MFILPPIPPIPPIPAIPKIPAMPVMPVSSKLPPIPVVPSMPSMSKVPPIPRVPPLPQVPSVPKVPPLPKIPPLPKLPPLPKMPPMPSTNISMSPVEMSVLRFSEEISNSIKLSDYREVFNRVKTIDLPDFFSSTTSNDFEEKEQIKEIETPFNVFQSEWVIKTILVPILVSYGITTGDLQGMVNFLAGYWATKTMDYKK